MFPTLFSQKGSLTLVAGFGLGSSGAFAADMTFGSAVCLIVSLRSLRWDGPRMSKALVRSVVVSRGTHCSCEL